MVMKNFFLFFALSFLILCSSFFSCSSKKTKEEMRFRKNALESFTEKQESERKKNIALEEYVKNLSLEEKLPQLFVINLEGDKKFYPVEKLNGRPLVAGGYIFFSYNIADSAEKIIHFTEDIKNYCKQNEMIVPYLSLDMEGGDVCRLKNIALSMPSAKKMSETFSIEQSYKLYSSIAKQVASLGFTLNFAPIVEVLTDDNAIFLDERSFGDSKSVQKMSRVFINAFQNNRVGTVIKHFPGNSNTDPHTGLPHLTLDKNYFEEEIFHTFLNVASCSPSSILMSHAKVSFFGENEKSEPACFSKYWVSEMVRNKLKFNGLIFSDDIFMAALAKNGYPENVAAIKAIEAGVDVIMISEKRFLSPLNALLEKAKTDNDFAEKINKAVLNVLKFKIQYKILESGFLDDGFFVKPASSVYSIEERLHDFYSVAK